MSTTHPFTPEQIADIYHMITSQNESFVRAIAQCSIDSSMSVKASMWEEMEDPKPALPTISDAKDMALDYFDDMLADFNQAFRNHVEAITATVEYELRPTVTFTEETR